MSEFSGHLTVLRDELINIVSDSFDYSEKLIFADLTFGGGGHSFYLLEKFPNSTLLCFDQDLDAIKHGQMLIEAKVLNDRIKLIHANFTDFNLHTENLQFDAIIADLGVSSHHLDSPERGFSFRAEGPLDMRMDQVTCDLTAADVVNDFPAKDLIEIFTIYGEEKFATRIVENIIEKRKEERIETTHQLENIVFHSYPRSLRLNRRKHPATQVFQALRIYINSELDSITKAIPDCLDRLKINGKMGIITFHSLEDRIIKNIFKEASLKSDYRLINKKPIEANQKEIFNNNRARSAKLRGIERVVKNETK